MERLLLLIEPARATWRALGRWTRLAVAGGSAAIVLAIVVFAATSAGPQWETAYARLSEEDAGAIVARLKESKTPYRVSDSGAIQVPRDRVHETRMELATAGLPRGGSVGFELFNQTSFGVTEFVQRLNYQRGLEGELARTIAKLEPVEQARVHLALPQPSLFSDLEKPTTASVVLRLKPGRRLERPQVQSIVNLLSRSVEGLKPTDVTVVDSTGALLSGDDPLAGDAARTTTGQIEAKRLLETEMEKQVQAMLDTVLGPRRASVRVNADLSWDQVEANSETFSPPNRPPQVRSTREVTERSGASPLVGGAPGADANIPPTQEPIAQPGQERGPFERRDSTTNYELSRTVEKTTRAGGALDRLSVAVVLDSTAPVDQAQLDAIRSLVSAAVGLDPQRGDTVSVAALPFDRSASERIQKQFDDARQWDLILSAARIVAALLGPALLLLALWLTLRRPAPRRATRTHDAATRQERARQAAGDGKAAPRDRARGATALAPAPGAEPATSPDDEPREDDDEGDDDEAALSIPSKSRAQKVRERRRHAIRDQITRLATQNPDTMAQLIQTWIDEDRRN
jgi:flagellar M-ring protein FliF